MATHNITENIQSGTKARLIPVVADSKKEERATSVLLSSFMFVPQFADAVLSEVGAKIGARSEIKCYTEIVFKSKEQNKLRPDGLIVISRSGKEWSALIESKIGNNELQKEQIEAYLDIAKEVGADALITISNQFATIPTHHPLNVNKVKTRSVDLFHFSWLSLLTKATVISEAKTITDREQAMVLKELVRYLKHPYSGVSAMSSMNSEWKEICNQIQQGAVVKKTSPEVTATASTWQQLLRYMALELTMSTNSMVQISLSRAHVKEPMALLQADMAELSSKHTLSGALSVPNAAGSISITADFMRRVLIISMRVNAPDDKSRATASINWLTRQLKGVVEASDVLVKVIWPGTTVDTQCRLQEIIDDPSCLVPDAMKNIPRAFEVIRVVDMGAKFKAPMVFVETAVAAIQSFYRDAGQNLSKWVAPPPKTKSAGEQNSEDSLGALACEEPSVNESVIEISEPKSWESDTYKQLAVSELPNEESEG
jgi:hypothetical protein